MGIDIKKHHVKSGHRKAPKSQDAYLRLLFKLYDFLARRTEAPFNATVAKRLKMSRTNQPPVSLSKIARYHREGQIVVVIGKVMNDERYVTIPQMTVAALKISKTAKSRILEAGGEFITLDELAQRAPLGENTILLRGKRTSRKVYKHFGAVGEKRSKTKPKVRSRGRKFEAKY